MEGGGKGDHSRIQEVSEVRSALARGRGDRLGS